MRGTGTEQLVVAMKSWKQDGAKGLRQSAMSEGQPQRRDEPEVRAKPFHIPKELVWKAYKQVRENKGAAGCDLETIEEFEKNLSGNLYKIWNRMSSGTYFPPPVRAVSIPKKGGGERVLGIPTVADRVAQTVAKMYLEPMVEPLFHQDSYGYRPGRSAHQALVATRRRCWRYDWVIDLDIKGFFDNLDHELLMEAVRKYTQCRWVLLYVQRWLQAPVQTADGNFEQRLKGTPQGGVISPLLANIFLHLAFDDWMSRKYPSVPFERYADDVVVHCKSLAQAEFMLRKIEERLEQWKLQLHPQKTKIVYCKDDDRPGSHPSYRFDFLGYTFRPRRSKNRNGKLFVSFTPAVCNEAKTSLRRRMRKWKPHLWSHLSIKDLAERWNPVLRGWIWYYRCFYPSALYPLFKHLNRTLARWVMRKYKRYRGRLRCAFRWLSSVASRESQLFAHWAMLGLKPGAG